MDKSTTYTTKITTTRNTVAVALRQPLPLPVQLLLCCGIVGYNDPIDIL